MIKYLLVAGLFATMMARATETEADKKPKAKPAKAQHVSVAVPRDPVPSAPAMAPPAPPKETQGEQPDGRAVRNENEVLFKNGYSELIYDPEDIPMIGVKTGYKTFFLFPSDDDIVKFEVGIRGSALEVKQGKNWVWVRPGQPRLATNMFVATAGGRVYAFDLQEGVARIPHKKVMVLRPDMELDPDGGPAIAPPPAAPMSRPIPGGSQGGQAVLMTRNGNRVAVDDLGQGQLLPAPTVGPTAPAPIQVVQSGVPGADIVRRLDTDYKIQNQKPKLLMVDAVSNDGYRTFVRMTSSLREAPLFYRVSDGKREILTYRVDPSRDPRDKDMYVIPRLVDVGVVRLGDCESLFTWKKTN